VHPLLFDRLNHRLVGHQSIATEDEALAGVVGF